MEKLKRFDEKFNDSAGSSESLGLVLVGIRYIIDSFV